MPLFVICTFLYLRPHYQYHFNSIGLIFFTIDAIKEEGDQALLSVVNGTAVIDYSQCSDGTNT